MTCNSPSFPALTEVAPGFKSPSATARKTTAGKAPARSFAALKSPHGSSSNSATTALHLDRMDCQLVKRYQLQLPKAPM